MASIHYLLDSQNIIQSISGEWDVFAQKNGAEQLIVANVVGQSMFKFISGKVTKQFYDQLIRQAHTLAKTITFNYRCDSPEQKRFMEFHISPLSNGETLITSHFVHSKRVKKKSFTYLVNERTKGSKILCSICNRIYDHKAWLELEDCAHNNPIPITYGICQECSVTIGDKWS